MEVILLERIEKLGQMGDIVKVKPGYARNFLLPRHKALRATEANKAHFEAQRAQLEANNLKLREEADAVATKLNGLSVTLIRQAGEAGQLYGSVNARDIANSVTEAGFTVTRNQVKLADPIKYLGLYEVSVSLHPEVSVSVTANVARSEDEATIQAETGKAVTGGDEEADQEAAAELEAIFEEGAAEAAAEELAAEDGEDAQDALIAEAAEEETAE
ncbi:50S ribosomal protein L9 [Magnetovibrio sp. PR-2]|uniref:50S ribosomal protein L9 n=1 Tax=Magnetovibrio sp. PR-2 TaxID=3120356 RepID=UPI002FCDFC98